MMMPSASRFLSPPLPLAGEGRPAPKASGAGRGLCLSASEGPLPRRCAATLSRKGERGKQSEPTAALARWSSRATFPQTPFQIHKLALLSQICSFKTRL